MEREKKRDREKKEILYNYIRERYQVRREKRERENFLCVEIKVLC